MTINLTKKHALVVFVVVLVGIVAYLAGRGFNHRGHTTTALASPPSTEAASVTAPPFKDTVSPGSPGYAQQADLTGCATLRQDQQGSRDGTITLGQIKAFAVNVEEGSMGQQPGTLPVSLSNDGTQMVRQMSSSNTQTTYPSAALVMDCGRIGVSLFSR